VERGRHAELLVAEGLYAELYRTQFARQETTASNGTTGRVEPEMAVEPEVTAGPALVDADDLAEQG
jgi:ATP-binding cassette subfamily B protein